MSSYVDVLAAMDDMFQGLQPIPSNLTATEYSFRRDMREFKYSQARAAVAEMIEADAEFDKARDGYNPLYASRDQLDRYLAAEERRANALARVTGGAA